jgi:hypothetical protein
VLGSVNSSGTSSGNSAQMEAAAQAVLELAAGTLEEKGFCEFCAPTRSGREPAAVLRQRELGLPLRAAYPYVKY